jgi:hypothetical protein
MGIATRCGAVDMVHWIFEQSLSWVHGTTRGCRVSPGSMAQLEVGLERPCDWRAETWKARRLFPLQKTEQSGVVLLCFALLSILTVRTPHWLLLGRVSEFESLTGGSIVNWTHLSVIQIH